MYALSDTYNAAGTGKDKFFERLLSSGPGINILVNISDYKLAYYNERFTDNFKYSEQEIAGDFTFLKLLQATDYERFLVQLRNICKGLQPGDRHTSYILSDKTGQGHLWHVYGSVFDIAGEDDPFCHLYLLPEVSTKQIPFLSFDSRELFLEQLQYTNFGAFEWIVDSNNVCWSDGVYDIYNIDKDQRELSYSYIGQFVHPEDLQRVKLTIVRALEMLTGFDIEIRIITPRQQIKTIHVIAEVILSDNGSPLKIVGSIHDITESRTIEQNLEKHVFELNRSNKELEEFAYVASHDLQEPLRKITTFSGRLTEKYGDVLSGDGKMYLERIVASADNMRILINNLLEFSRVTRDKQPFEVVNLKFVLRQALSDLELPIEETGAKINISADMPLITGSMSQMKQLFFNIIGNAIKFRRENQEPIIDITAAPLSKEDKEKYSLPVSGNYSRIKVSDKGIGFANEYAQRIFQIFQRLNGKSDYPGSGIGLAICKKIVDHHKGVIFATSVEGEGAEFTVILPTAGENHQTAL